MAVLVAY